MKIYNVYQSGKRLYIDEKENPDNKIACNKYESEQTTLRLVSDGTLPPRLYWALKNPKLSNKYFILPLINNEDLVIDTSVTATPGLWDLILVGTPDDYVIEGTDIDQSKLTYVSDHFGRLFVRDNFLEELDFEEQCSPTFKVFYDEIIFQLSNKANSADIPDKMSDLENDTNFISGVALKDDGEGNVNIIGTTFSGGETEEGGGSNYTLPIANEEKLGGVKPLNKTDDMTLEVGVDKDGRLFAKGKDITVDSKLDEESTNPVQNKVLTKEVITLKEHNTQLKETIEKLQIKVTTEKASFHNIKDSANMKVLDFGMKGKTTQDGTPTPENQVEIVNAGVYNEATGRYEIVLRINKKNFFDINAYREEVDGITVSDGVINITKSGKRLYYDLYLPAGTYNAKATVENYCSFSMACSDGTTVINSSVTNNELNSRFTIKEGQNVIFSLYGGGFDATDISLHRKIYDIRIGLYSENEYEEYVGQPLTLTSPVPLTKWDYMTKRDGVWGWSIQAKEYVFDGTEFDLNSNDYSSGTQMRGYINIASAPINTECRCNMFRYHTSYGVAGTCGFWFGTTFCICIPNSWLEPYGFVYSPESDNYTNARIAFKAMLADKGPIRILVDMQEEQAFHPLPDEEQTLLNNLETYYGVTNLYNDQGCPMWLCYTCDSKLYVDQKLEQINNALLSLGANV